MASRTTSFLSSKQRDAAGTLFAIALHQAQLNQTRLLGLAIQDEASEKDGTSCSGTTTSGDSFENRERWACETSGLLLPVLKFLDVDSVAWPGIEEAAGSSPAKSHVGALLRLLSEESDDPSSSQSSDQQIALVKTADVMEQSMEPRAESSEFKKKKHREYEQECRGRLSTTEMQPISNETVETAANKTNKIFRVDNASRQSVSMVDKELVEEERMPSYQKKVTVLYELLSACLADRHDDKMKSTRKRKGYDARHRVALRLLATWLDIEWKTMEAVETVVACSAMAIAKEEESNQEESGSPNSKWDKWKRGGIIGAAAVTGGTLLAVTGGLAAPAIAAGLNALAPTLGTLIPVIGASGFAAAASAAGTVAGSVAVAASFGAAGAGLAGTKMARRTGSIDEFEFKAIGENHQQVRLAVEIDVSGCVFIEEDFVRPWEGLNDNMERYALQWESKNLFAVSTAIQDWLASSIATELMKQGAMLTVLSTLAAALAWPATLLAATGYIDGKWTIAIDRSDKAGKLLAEVLLKGLQGNRPVTLVGYSLGARVIFKCLQTLAETEDNAELVERVVLLGAPISIKDENWEAARKMVAGRFVNAYSSSDWTLGVAFRASLLSQGLAGIQPVDVPGIESVDVTDIIEGHSSYLWASQQILEQLELDACCPVSRITVIQ